MDNKIIYFEIKEVIEMNLKSVSCCYSSTHHIRIQCAYSIFQTIYPHHYRGVKNDQESLESIYIVSFCSTKARSLAHCSAEDLP